FELSAPRVSIIRQGIVEMGRLAVSTLFAVMGGDRPDSIRIPTELVVRESTGPAPQAAPEEATQAC
ncbi:MAG: substrate-binding domain-containing protein, partial [Propionibacteriaceae bacterium]|nr:substrate-binding domain-containing protein [Propionibacteriaceae bacterium]